MHSNLRLSTLALISTVLLHPVAAFGAPDLALSKNADAAMVSPGDLLVYTLEVTYLSGTPDRENLIFTETVPQHTTYASGSSDVWLCSGLGAGSTCVLNAGPGPLADPLSFAVVVDAVLPSGVTAITNTAAVTTATDPDPSNNTATVATPLVAGPDLALEKSDGGATASPGDTLVYSLDAGYVSGSADGEDLIFTETVPEHTTYAPGSSDVWLCSGLGAGSICALNAGPAPLVDPLAFGVVVDAVLPTGVTAITNTAVLSVASDPNPSNNTSTVMTPISITRGGPDLELSKDDGGVTAMLGGTIVYALDVTYVTGGADGESLIFTETVPAHTTFAPGLSDFWLCSGLGAGSTCTRNAGPGPLAAPVLFAVTVDAVVPTGVMAIDNTATVGTATDPNPSNNTASTSTPFAGPDLELTKDDGGITATLGGTIIYTFAVSYVTGSPDGEDLVFTETVPDYTTFAPGPSDLWLCGGTGPGSTCVHNAGPGPLASPPVFAVLVDADVPAGVSTIDNTATVTTATDPVPANNTSSTSTPLTVPVELMSFGID